MQPWRYSAVGLALFVILPALLAIDTIVRPAVAWRRIGRSRWPWLAAFAAAPVAVFVTGSYLPGLVVLVVSAFYLAKVRSVLDIATGVERASREPPQAPPANDP